MTLEEYLYFSDIKIEENTTEREKLILVISSI